jgi:hypothetical protein
MSVKLYSFTVGRPGGWSCVTPNGLITAEQGTTVTVVVSETWEEGLKAVLWAAEKPQDEEPR